MHVLDRDKTKDVQTDAICPYCDKEKLIFNTAAADFLCEGCNEWWYRKQKLCQSIISKPHIEICPKCGTKNITYGEQVVEANQIGYAFTCQNPNCHFEGIEWYNLIFNVYTDDDGNEICVDRNIK